MTREYVLERYSNLLGLPKDHTLCVNLEKSTHNWSVNRSLYLGDVAASDNPAHMSRYKHKFLQIQYNIKNSPVLKDRILSGKIKTTGVMELAPHELWPGGPHDREMVKNINKNLKKDANAMILQDPNYKGIFKCKRCKSFKTTYYEMQTRSADEPMTVFVTCINCDARWKS